MKNSKNIRISIIHCTLLLVALISAQPLGAAPIWREISIPTRVAAPNTNLLADLYANDSSTAKPVILIQTPYNKLFYRISLNSVLNTAGASVPYDSAHYNYVIVDWRGFYANKAVDVTPANRGQDGYDIVEWIAKQKWCNGKIGTWGGSALGQVQFQTAAQQPPHLVCAAPFIKDFATKYEDYYYGGVFRREHVESLERLGFASVNTVLSVPVHNTTWKFIENQNDPTQYAVPMFLCSGWFDHFPDDVLRAFQDLQTFSDASVRTQHKLMFGPFEHSEVGQAQQGVLSFPDVEGVPTQLGMRFFDHYLRGIDNGWQNLPAVQYYQMGDNHWVDDTQWPASGTHNDTLYFHAAHALRPEPVTDKKLTPPDTIPGDPRNPVPTIGGSRFNPADKSILMGPQDIASLLKRPDVWSYQTDVLSSPLVIRGESNLHLKLSCSTKDADLCARLCDIYPDGRWIILTQGAQRLRLRITVDKEDLMPLNTVQDVPLHFQNIAQTFLPGHRLGIMLSASDYPMFDLNLNNGEKMYSAGDTVSTNLMVWHTQSTNSMFVYSSAKSSTAVEQETEHSVEGLLISPNPAHNAINLQFNLDIASEVHVRVYDLMGRQLSESPAYNCSTGTQNIALELPDLPAQSLIIQLRSASSVLSAVVHKQ